MLGIVVSLPWELKSLTRQAIPAGTWKAITEDTLVALSGIGAERAYAAAYLIRKLKRNPSAKMTDWWGAK